MLEVKTDVARFGEWYRVILTSSIVKDGVEMDRMYLGENWYKFKGGIVGPENLLATSTQMPSEVLRESGKETVAAV